MTKTYLKYRSRVIVISSLVIMSWVGLAVRLFDVQIISGQQYRERGFAQSQYREPIPAIRGNIFDRNQKTFTRNIIHYSIAANPALIENPEQLAEKLSRTTGRSREHYLKKLSYNTSFVYLERNLRKEVFSAGKFDEIQNLIIERHARRFYPQQNIAAQIVGATDVDDRGISGLEGWYDDILQGEPGWILKQKNGHGRLNPKSNFPTKPPTDGLNILTTLDLNYQSILQDELDYALKDLQATSATGIILNPQTGDILAIASVPDFNPNHLSDFPTENQKIRAITDQFEPGSTYKIVATTAALDQHCVSPQQEFNCEYGSYQLKDVRINDHEEYGLLTVSQIIQHSSNVGIIKIAELVGKKQLYRYSRDYGFGSLTNISLYGEEPGTLRRVNQWSDLSLPEMSMGHEVAVTGIQLAMAYAAIANGGYLLRPRIVDRIVDQSGRVVETVQPEVVRKISSLEIMGQVKDMLVKVVEGGTGNNAQIRGWNVAGKTGTAQKFIDGKYSNSKFISNFVGFLPADNPQLLCAIIIDEPRYGKHWGSEGAAPVFNRVMCRIINLDDSLLPPEHPLEKDPGMIAGNTEAEPTIKPAGMPLLQTGDFFSAQTKFTHVPEVRGMSLRKAILQLKQAHLTVRVNGSGKVVWQSPAPGVRVPTGSKCEIGLQ